MDASRFVFKRYAGEYDHWFETHPAIYQEQLALLMRVLPEGRMKLEVGVGSGRFASRLGIRHGLDPSPSLSALANKRGIETVQGVGEFLPYRANTFDCILMMTVICFMDDPARSFSEAFRVIRQGGILVTAFLEKGGGIAKREGVPEHQGRFLKFATFFTVDDVTGMLAAAGFSRVSPERDLQGLCILIAQK
ncbi:class I SAM-dependent methyltransferase [Methanoregula sp.]|uniref:class I SAM-dependent methyltransferase n=1 Tax=Methanoregula sp. TaxID=2052170 RepID=UPI002C114C42|nr:class I SAM-dependent methyltransferase [Methanoregula sp.]HVP97308.1 class I SAM-dependent methyltransferase [Methanoregula sp.]